MSAPASIPAKKTSVARCRHCDAACAAGAVTSAHGTFCCRGCEAVFALLASRQLTAYYNGDERSGVSQKQRPASGSVRFLALDDPDVASRFVRFDDGEVARATFAVPDVHCASCVWLLEQLWRFDPGVSRTEVDLQRRALHVDYRPKATSVRRIAEQLAALGYEPVIDGEREAGAMPASTRRLYQQIGVAGFAFGNIMLFSIPRYANGAPLAGGFQELFDALNLALAIPVLVFSAAGYFRTGWQAIRARTITIEVPVALGLTVLFLRSVSDIVGDRGPGFFDSFSGLVFFLLVGRLFQMKAFDRLAFDRTFRSFLPLSVQVERESGLEAVPVGRLVAGDRLVLRRHEIVPADGHLLGADAAVDCRFLTGEETPVLVRAGERVRAGGRAASAMRVSVDRPVSESELAGIWSNPLFGASRHGWLAEAGTRFGAWFTVAAIGLSAIGAWLWWPDAGAAASVATAVLIVACPCALTLAAPITLGTAMGVLGRRGIYLKEPAVVLDLSRIDTVVFDKTGTLTTGARLAVTAAGGLTDGGWRLVRRLALESSHPVSRAVAGSALGHASTSALLGSLPAPRDLSETAGEGVLGVIAGRRVAIGSAPFIAELTHRPAGSPDRTHVCVGDEVGWVRLSASPRRGVEEAAQALSRDHRLLLVSGDAPGDLQRWAGIFRSQMYFRQSPAEKLAIVAGEKQMSHRVLMVGDGLNDAGALRAADVGLAVSDDSACVVPACDGVIGGDRIADLPAILRFAQRARWIVVTCFVVSIAYNAVGLTLALTGALTPLASAILMPLSSLTIVAISSVGVRWSAAKGLPS